MIDDRDLEDKYLDKINEYLHSRTIPNDSIKKMMFYFKILSHVVDYDFKENFTNYHNPYFKSNEEMNSFVALAQKLNPGYLQSLNVLIIYNDKNYYSSKDDHLQEYKIINPKLSNSPQFQENYKNNFNIYNIDTSKKSIEIKENDKLEFSVSISIDENYYDENVENQPTIDDNPTTTPTETPEQTQRFERYRRRFNRKRLKQLEKEDQEHFLTPINDEEEEELSNHSTRPKKYKAKIVNKLVASQNWIQDLYEASFNKLYNNMKAMEFEEDRMRTKSITLPRNIFFYLTLAFMIILFSCACVMIHEAKSLNDNNKFWLLGGHNRTSKSSTRNCEGFKHNFLKSLHTFPEVLGLLSNDHLKIKNNDINYSDDSVIVQNKHAFYLTKTTNDLAITTGVFSILFVLFVCYMWYRVAREQKETFTKKPRKNIGINLIHVVILIFLTLLLVVIAIVGEGYAAAGFLVKTYDFIHSKQRIILEMNSIIIVCYILIFLFYFKH